MTHHVQPRNLIRALLLLWAIALAGVAGAQSPPPTRIGYVDMKRLLDNAPQVVAGRQKLEREFAARDTTLKADEKRAGELRARQTREAASLSRADADSLQREIDALDRSIKRSRDGLRADLKTRSDQELDRSWREINDAVVEFAREQSYDLIVPSPVVYASPKVDVTEQILERLRRQAAKGAAK
ncbi:OmpH family outer membrane protein [Dokdonella soli]|uniref:OmpH family outer membrane protein n=1 Tax=Dokdonella soli TaxID=529810 RepID=A0ABN1IW97_9GAMM